METTVTYSESTQEFLDFLKVEKNYRSDALDLLEEGKSRYATDLKIDFKNSFESEYLTKKEIALTLSTVDSIVAFFLNPFISGILILIFIAGIYFEMKAPGFGFAGLAALIALVLYLVPYYLNGIAENWEIIALFVGILLIAVEIFILPGFGVAGLSGIILTLGALVLIMINNENFDFEFVDMNDVLVALASATGGLLGGGILLFVLASRISNTRFYKNVALTYTQDRNIGYTVNANRIPLVGKTGTAHTVLRPSGRVMIEGTIYDAYTRGEYIEQGKAIEVVSDEGTTLKVKSIELASPQ